MIVGILLNLTQHIATVPESMQSEVLLLVMPHAQQNSHLQEILKVLPGKKRLDQAL